MKTQDLRTFRSTLIVTTLLLALSSLGLTQNTANSTAISVPHLIKFSGVLKDEAGAPKTGIVGITFAFYKEQQGGTPLWLETQNVQADASGRYTVMLGATKSDGLPVEFFTSNEARWVAVQPQGQNEQSRVLLVSAPYALKAADAETLEENRFQRFNWSRLRLILTAAQRSKRNRQRSSRMRSVVPVRRAARPRSFPFSPATAEAPKLATRSSPRPGAPSALVARSWGRQGSSEAATTEPFFKQLKPATAQVPR